MSEILVIAILEQLSFLELSSENILDLDAAVQQMESIASMLNKLTDTDKTDFIRITNLYAETQMRAGGPTEKVQFFQALPENLGLI